MLNPTNGHMALLAGTGLALMGLSIPGRRLQTLLGPSAFFAGLFLVDWALFRRHWFAEGALIALVILAVIVERRLSSGSVPTSREPVFKIEVMAAHFNHFADGSGAGKYATIRVSATESVRRCRVHLARIVTRGVDVPVRAPVPLRWIGVDDLEIDLVPGLPREATVAFTESGRPGETLISTDSHAPRGIPWQLGEGLSVLTVVISGDDVPPSEIEMKVYTEQDWRSLRGLPGDAEVTHVGPEPFARPLQVALDIPTGATGPHGGDSPSTGRGTIPYPPWEQP